MAGRPQRKLIVKELERRAAQVLDEENATSLDFVCEWCENGSTLHDLAEELTEFLGFKVWASSVQRIVVDNDPRNYDRLKAARAKGAHLMLEEAVSIADTAGESPSGVAKAKLRSDVRVQVASRWNREELGAHAGAAVTLNIGELHLNALRAIASRPSTARAISGIAECETEAVADCKMQELPSGDLVTAEVTAEPDFVVESSNSTT